VDSPDAEKGWNAAAVGESFCEVFLSGECVTKGSVWAVTREGKLEYRIGVVSGPLVPGVSRLLADLIELSFGEKAVSLVSGVPLNEPPSPLDECGEEGRKPISSLESMAVGVC